MLNLKAHQTKIKVFCTSCAWWDHKWLPACCVRTGHPCRYPNVTETLAVVYDYTRKWPSKGLQIWIRYGFWIDIQSWCYNRCYTPISNELWWILHRGKQNIFKKVLHYSANTACCDIPTPNQFHFQTNPTSLSFLLAVTNTSQCTLPYKWLSWVCLLWLPLNGPCG